MPALLPAVGNFFIATFTAVGVSGVTAVHLSAAMVGLFKALTINAIIGFATRAMGTHGEDDDGTTWQAVDYDA